MKSAGGSSRHFDATRTFYRGEAERTQSSSIYRELDLSGIFVISPRQGFGQSSGLRIGTALPQQLALSWRNADRGLDRTTGLVARARRALGRSWAASPKDRRTIVASGWPASRNWEISDALRTMAAINAPTNKASDRQSAISPATKRHGMI